jgi:MHS family proline/betaine transporter-like MFS transporter
MKRMKLIVVGGVANAFEWYDYALFGHFITVLSVKFFPSGDPQAALLQTFLVFAVGYLVRPLGGVFFGIIGDKFGRKTALSSAIICMAFPTAVIGLLPSYETLGIASTIMMVITRIIQGSLDGRRTYRFDIIYYRA